MVLVHKLRKMEEIETEQFRNGEDQRIPSLRVEDETDHEVSSQGENPQTTTLESQLRRPLTRSQTGYVPKRRRRDDSPAVVPRRASPPRKKRKPSVKPSEDAYADPPQEQDTSTPALSKRSVSEVSTVPSEIPPPSSTQFSFVTLSSSSTISSATDPPSDRRGPRSRVMLPTPVPNLTKKSRGRRVPTNFGTGASTDADPKDARLYVCKVESCRKCFHRGEHLKRHIRSIHTHEKPFACLHADCDKRFNRHDNLLQHLKVHKDLPPPPPGFVEDAGSPLQPRRASTPPPEHRYSPAREAYETSINQARRAAAFRRHPSYVAYGTPYGTTSEPTMLATNMAVSSLRTEIPPSPS